MILKFFRILIGLIVVANLLILLSGRFYLYKAVWYNLADIDDWKHFNNRNIPNGEGIPLPAAHDYNQVELNQVCLERLEKYNTVSFVALRNDSVVYERYWDDYNDSSLSSSFSMAKSITSILIGLAVDEGKIKSIDDPVGNYLPSFHTGKKAQVTIRDLLQMSSGIKWDENYANPISVTTEAYYGSHLEEMAAAMEVDKKPGEVFDYVSCNQIVLQQILTRVTGKTISEYMSEKLWKPLHAMYPATWSLDRENGNEKAFCCINSNARDFSRIGLLFLHGGKLYDHQIINQQYVNESVTPAKLVDDEQLPCDFYGLGWWLAEIEFRGKKVPVYYMRGILGQYVMVCPSFNIVVCRLGHRRDDDYTTADKHHRIDIFEYTRAVLNAYAK